MDGKHFPPFPHHRLLAYEVALEFVRLIYSIHISDAEQRKHARASATSCARNLAEGAGRRSRADKRRCYGIAFGEFCESVAAVEIDHAQGGCPIEELDAVYGQGGRLNAMLEALTR